MKNIGLFFIIFEIFKKYVRHFSLFSDYINESYAIKEVTP